MHVHAVNLMNTLAVAFWAAVPSCWMYTRLFRYFTTSRSSHISIDNVLSLLQLSAMSVRTFPSTAFHVSLYRVYGLQPQNSTWSTRKWMFSSDYNDHMQKAKGEMAGTMMWEADDKAGGIIMWEKTNLLALHNFHSEAEYRTKKTNMRLEGNTVFSYILNTNSAWKGAGEGRENTQEGERASLMEECKGGH